MCGIIAANQSRDVSKFLLNGLRKLEYRGYDSCGIGTWKRWGKPKFSKSLDINKLQIEEGNVGMAHTRWATHGNIDIKNAHPIIDASNRVAVVHNGIVSNLKDLINGAQLKTDTDTEIISNLLSTIDGPYLNCIQACNNIIKGNSAYICWFLDTPQHLYCTTTNQPMYVTSNGLCSSDKSSLIGECGEVYKLENGEIAQLNQDKTIIWDNLQEKSPKWEKVDTTSNFIISSAPYPHFMLKEIHEQIVIKPKTNWKKLCIPDKLILVGCGSSYHAAKFVEPFFENANIDTRVEYATELLWKKVDLFCDYLLISQSGETKDIADVVEKLSECTCKFLLTNNSHSSISEKVTSTYNLRVGPEFGVAATKTLTGSILSLLDLAKHYGSNHTFNKEDYIKLLDKILGNVDIQYEDLHKTNIKSIAESAVDRYKSIFVLGHGYNYPIALEGALKLKEISNMHAEGMISSEIKHGPITMTGPDVLSIFLNFGQNPEIQSNISQVRARQGKCLAITNEVLDGIGVHKQIYIPTDCPITFSLCALVVMQLFSYYCAIKKQLNPDRPKMLAKAITV